MLRTEARESDAAFVSRMVLVVKLRCARNGFGQRSILIDKVAAMPLLYREQQTVGVDADRVVVSATADTPATILKLPSGAAGSENCE